MKMNKKVDISENSISWFKWNDKFYKGEMNLHDQDYKSILRFYKGEKWYVQTPIPQRWE